MAINLTVTLADDTQTKLRMRDVTIGEYREARREGDGEVQELLLDAIEEVEGYADVDELSLGHLNAIVETIAEHFVPSSTPRSDTRTKSKRRERRRTSLR